jgi:hypothetical protein
MLTMEASRPTINTTPASSARVSVFPVPGTAGE